MLDGINVYYIYYEIRADEVNSHDVTTCDQEKDGLDTVLGHQWHTGHADSTSTSVIIGFGDEQALLRVSFGV
jgi:hypothetical protein